MPVPSRETSNWVNRRFGNNWFRICDGPGVVISIFRLAVYFATRPDSEKSCAWRYIFYVVRFYVIVNTRDDFERLLTSNETKDKTNFIVKRNPGITP